MGIQTSMEDQVLHSRTESGNHKALHQDRLRNRARALAMRDRAYLRLLDSKTRARRRDNGRGGLLEGRKYRQVQHNL